VSALTDRRWLGIALGLIVAFMVVEVVEVVVGCWRGPWRCCRMLRACSPTPARSSWRWWCCGWRLDPLGGVHLWA
jgi:hypothetical protein